MIQFVEEHKPDVIVYDVAPPYDTNWTFLRLMRNSKVMQQIVEACAAAFDKQVSAVQTEARRRSQVPFFSSVRMPRAMALSVS